jgi:hypothetical protein
MKMLKERLEITRSIMCDVLKAKKPFYMSAWFDYDIDEPCKTACCALGYAALDPRLQAEGLQLTVVDDYDNPIRTVLSIEDYNNYVHSMDDAESLIFQDSGVIPTYKGSTTYYAAAVFYDITYEAAQFLFDPGCYNAIGSIEPEEVIRHIDIVLNSPEEWS